MIDRYFISLYRWTPEKPELIELVSGKSWWGFFWDISLCDGWYICAAVLTPFFHFGRIEHDLFGVFFSSTNSKAIFWGTKTTNFYKNRSFWPQIQFFPRSFWVQFSAASGTPPSVFRPSTPPPGFHQGCTKLKSAWGLNFNISFRPAIFTRFSQSHKAQNPHPF